MMISNNKVGLTWLFH